ncbi:class I SAM-dependent methyltransferase [soil metagenome]
MNVTPYNRWRTYTVKVAGVAYEVATKPGAFAHGRLDPAAVLLAEHVAVKEGDTVVLMHCGNGLPAVAAAARHAGRIILVDRNIVSVQAAERTLAANRVTVGTAVLSQGTAALERGLEADTVVIRIPQERVALLQLLADAFAVLKIGGRCYIAGATNQGIKTAAATLESLFGNARVLSRDSSHRVASAVKRADAAADPSLLDNPYLQPDAFFRLNAVLRGTEYELYTRPGIFSWDHVDEATAILADAMEVPSGASVLDLGCGSGALGITAAKLSGGGPLCMLDADVEAVRSATRSAESNGVTSFRALVSDVASAVRDERFDVVVTNPPFHVGKATDLDVPMQFIEDAFGVLSKGGRLFLVANRTLPYEQAIRHRFGNVANLHDGPRFKVLTAIKMTTN